MKSYAETARALLANSGTSYWLRDAIKVMEQRDPVDAVKDAGILAQLCKMRLMEIQGERPPNFRYLRPSGRGIIHG